MIHFSHFTLATDYRHYALGRALQGLGYAFFFVPLSVISYSQLRAEQNNKASSLTNFFRNWGGQFWHRVCSDHVGTAARLSSGDRGPEPSTNLCYSAESNSSVDALPAISWLFPCRRCYSCIFPGLRAAFFSDTFSCLHGLLHHNWHFDPHCCASRARYQEGDAPIELRPRSLGVAMHVSPFQVLPVKNVSQQFGVLRVNTC